MTEIAAVTIRPAVADDVAAIARLHLQTHRETYRGLVPGASIEAFTIEARTDVWRAAVAAGRPPWVAEAAGGLVGFAAVRPAREPEPVRDVELGAVYVLAAHHGTGVGQRLLDAALGAAPASLWVFAANERARAFYERNGFRADGAEHRDPDFGDVPEIRMVR